MFLAAVLPLLAALILYYSSTTPSPSSLPASLLSSKSTSTPMTIPITTTFPPCPPLPKATGAVDLKLPPTEDRPHRFITLENGLEVVLISDPTSDKAAASMDVGVGHLSDPENLAGCAHFCEHLMFMGTKKVSEPQERCPK